MKLSISCIISSLIFICSCTSRPSTEEKETPVCKKIYLKQPIIFELADNGVEVREKNTGFVFLRTEYYSVNLTIMYPDGRYKKFEDLQQGDPKIIEIGACKFRLYLLGVDSMNNYLAKIKFEQI